MIHGPTRGSVEDLWMEMQQSGYEYYFSELTLNFKYTKNVYLS